MVHMGLEIPDPYFEGTDTVNQNSKNGSVRLEVAVYYTLNIIKSIQCRRESIPLVYMVVAQPCEEYHTFYYSG